MISIRPLLAEDLPVLADIENDANQAFVAAGVDCGFSPATTDTYLDVPIAAGFVAHTPEQAVGFVAIVIKDRTPFIHELSVRFSHGRQGVGHRLLQRAIEWAQEHRHRQMTLVTCRDLPFNGPFYESCGFRVFQPDPATRPELSLHFEQEKIDWAASRQTRTAMVLDL